MKIFFACEWSDNIGDQYKYFTPNNTGIWNNIQLAHDTETADVIVILDGIKNDNTINYKNKILIYVQREELTIKKINNKLIKKLNIDHVITHDNMFQASTYSVFLNKTYDELQNLQYIKNKKLSCIVSKKMMTQGHIDRVKFIMELSKRFPNQIDIYGIGWSKDDLGDNYKGELDCFHKYYGSTSKFDGLYNYEFSICIENCPENNCFSEKFNDAILALSTPVYYGCPNIGLYFPKDSFINLDIYDIEESAKIITKILNNEITPNVKSLFKSKDLIMNKYNIFNLVDKYISNNFDIEKTYADLVFEIF